MQYDLSPRILGHINMYLDCAFSPDGTMLAVVGWADGSQTYVPIKSGSKEYRPLEMAGPERQSHVFIWDVRTGTQQAHWEADSIEKAVFAPTGMTLATAHTHRICLRDAATGQVKKTFLENLSLKYTPGFWGVAFSSDGCRLAATLECDDPGGVYVVDLVADSRAMRLCTTDAREPSNHRSVLHCRFLPGDRLLVGTGYTYDAEDHIYLWDVTTGKRLVTFRGDTPQYEGEAGQPIILAPDGTHFVLVPEDFVGMASVWKLTEREGMYSWQEQSTFGGDLDAICLGTFSPNGRLFAAPETKGGADFNGDVPTASTVTLWEMPSGEKQVSFTVPGRCYCWAFDPSGKTFAALSGKPEGNYWGGAPEYLLHLWDTETGAERAVLRTESRRTNFLFHEPRNAWFSPDGTHLVVSHLRHAELWDLASIIHKL